MRGRQVIDAISYQGTITSTTGGVKINGVRVPLEDVAVIMLGNRTSISGGAMSLCARYDVIVLNCDWRGIPDFVAYGWSQNSRVATRHRCQAELSEPRRKSAWQAIVRAKILGQQRNLESLGSNVAARLSTIRKEVRSGDPSNCEAQAARLYWSAMFPDEGFLRTPGAPDHVNALLNYGYTVMRGFVIQAISAAGLWPTYGLWHRSRGNTFALADDLIEPFRPAVDHCVRRIASELTIEDRSAKKQLVAVTSEPMNASGTTIATEIFDIATALALYVEGDHDRFSPPAWNPLSIEAFEGEDG